MGLFSKATRKKAKLRLALCGTSGSGKTYSALLIAMGLGGKIALIDTENGSGSLYEHLCDYDVAEIHPPFTTEKYIQAIQEAEKEGYNVLIIDSLSHAWAGQGGILEEVDRRKTKNSFTAWRDVTPMHNRLIDTMLQSGMHIIVTMRTKTAYEMEKDDRGKVVPVKMGMAPVQRDGLEYEFTIVLDLDNAKHVATSGKDRTGLFDGKVFVPSEQTGRDLLEWLEKGVSVPATAAQLSQIWAEAKGLGLTGEDVREIMEYRFSITDKALLTFYQARILIGNISEIWTEICADENIPEDDLALEEAIQK